MAQHIPEKMQAWGMKIGKREPIRQQLPVPKPEADGLLIKISAMGVCHSDCALLGLDQPLPGMRNDFLLGHEACGEIVQLGSNVSESDFALGDTVAILVLSLIHI